MQQPQIRITRTPEMDSIFSYLKSRYRLMSEADIIKMVLSDFYYKITSEHVPTNEEMLAMMEEEGDRKEGMTTQQYEDWWNKVMKPEIINDRKKSKNAHST